MHLTFAVLRAACVLCAAAPAWAQAPAPPLLRAGEPLPPLLDLRGADPAELLPAGALDEAALEAIRLRWAAVAAPFADGPAARLALPALPAARRVALAQAANQALKAMNPSLTLYLAYDAAAWPGWDEALWGALDGGAIAPDDLDGPPERWRALLEMAQTQLPARPWTIWLPSDPGARAADLLGAGARLVAPSGGADAPPTALATLAGRVPAWAAQAEGGGGHLAFRSASGADASHWRFFDSEWRPVVPDRLGREAAGVTIVGRAEYDVQALLARARATQLRDASAIRTAESRLSVSIHVQAGRGMGADVGYAFRSFEKAGEPEELLQEEVLLNGVRANLHGGTQLPVVESKRSASPPVALSLTEMYVYGDGGPGGEGRRWIRFSPADGAGGADDADNNGGGGGALFTGRALIDEATGRVLEERSERSELPGIVKSESRRLTYGEPLPGFWRVTDVQTFERWVMAGAVAQVRRELSYGDFRINDEGFEASRRDARASKATMLRQTEDGLRYLARDGEGGRYIDKSRSTGGRAVGGGLLMDPSMQFPVVPGAALAFFDYDAFGKGVQYTAMVMGVYNMATISAPNLPGGFELGASAWGGFLPYTDLPVEDGRVQSRDGVSRQSAQARINAGRDLGANFRLRASGIFIYNRYSEAKDEDYRTPGYVPPPSGLTLGYAAELSWMAGGLQLRGSYGAGRRPDGPFGLPADGQRVADGGRYEQWGAAASYDLRLGRAAMLHGEAGADGGRGFDRFFSMRLGGAVPGIRGSALVTDRTHYASVGCSLPPSRLVRLGGHISHARARGMVDGKTYGFTGLSFSGDLPGFWWFTFVRADVSVGLQSDVPGARGVSGYIALLRVF